MTEKQISILLYLVLFLIFDLICLVLYQQIKSALTIAGQTSPEMIATYNVTLDVNRLNTLLAKMMPTQKPVITPGPFIGLVEPKVSTAAAKTNLTVNLYNGSGMAGQASVTSRLLTGSGYRIGRVTNADRSDYRQTTISYSPAHQVFARDLQSILQSRYNEVVLQEHNSDSLNIDIVLGQPAQ